MLVRYCDFETTVDAQGKHHVNLAVVKSADGERTWVYRGPKALADLNNDCIRRDSKHKNATFVFLNSSGFDAHFWYAHLCSEKTPPKQVIRRHQRILTMELPKNGIVIRDALLFIPGTPLSKYPTMFGLDCADKGDFPHALNKAPWTLFDPKRTSPVYEEMIDGVQHRFPPINYFLPESKTTKALNQLTTWHKEQVALYEQDPNLKYVPETQLEEYCMLVNFSNYLISFTLILT
jgi:hypothetical protein